MTDRPEIIIFGDIVEDNGKTIRENNQAIQHKYQLGEIVEVDIDISEPGAAEGVEINLRGTCQLFVVGHGRDCDGTPLYVISDLQVKYPVGAEVFSKEHLVYRTLAKVVEHGYGEDSLRSTGVILPLSVDTNAWFRPPVEL